MPTYLVMIIAAVAVVGIFIIGMSLTLMIKGHHIRSEIGDNPNMKKLGLKCAVKEMMDEERELRGVDACIPVSCGTTDCSVCEEHTAV